MYASLKNVEITFAYDLFDQFGDIHLCMTFLLLCLSDSDLEFLSKYCFSLSYINLKGCISVTDISISNLIRRCFKLSSLVVCDTAFGKNSIQALCSSIPQFADASASHHVNRHYDSLAANLETLHMGFCKGKYYFTLSFEGRLFSLVFRENLF